MAQINMNRRDKGRKRNKPTRRTLRVDFTPMVDMNMLLITFFMFCTTLSIPQVMDIVIPTKDPGNTQAPKSKTITLILGEENKVYYYEGIANYEDYTSLKETDYSNDGLRNVILNKNTDIMAQARELKVKKAQKQISDKEFKEKMGELKKSQEGIVVLIKPTDASSYKNLVDALDEMQVCNVSKYAIVNMDEGDRFLIENYKMQGKLTVQAEL